MYNYHADLIIKIDVILLGASLLLAAAIVLYILVKRHTNALRDKGLLELKRALYTLFQSGNEDKTCLGTVAGSSVQQFLDIQGNRRRDAVFFNQKEQALFRECFVSSRALRRAEEAARNSHNKWQRIEAIIALGYSGKEETVRILRKSLTAKDQDIHYFTAIALAQMKTADSAHALIGLLEQDHFMQRKLVSLLESFPAGIAGDIIKLLDEKDPSVRFWALKLLPKFKPMQCRKKVEALAGDPSDKVRAAVCECLGALGGKESRPVLEKCLEDETWFVRMRAVQALAQTLGGESIPVILGSLNDGSIPVLDTVKAAIKDNILAALPYMKKTFLEGDDFARRLCLEAIESSLAETADPALREKIVRAFKDIDATSAKTMERWLDA
ncbi:MAG: HEAT repeat domain-containing protein [Candidatus Omnitrophota bacterium]